MDVYEDQPLAAFVSGELRHVRESLAELSGDNFLVDIGPNATGLMKRVAKAWKTPLNELTCAHARVLVGQKFGLRWIAQPVAIFVARYPRAFCELYDGDLTSNALCAHEELMRHAPLETRAMLECDYQWMAETYAADPDAALFKEALAALAQARKVAAIRPRTH